MKKLTLNPLTLDKETIALLDGMQLQAIAGGRGAPAYSSACSSGGSVCPSPTSTGCGSGSSQCLAN